MAYTGYTVKHLIVKFDGAKIGTVHVADSDSADRLIRWFSGEQTLTPDRRPKGPAPISVKGAESDDERLECMEHFGLKIEDVPEVKDDEDLTDHVEFEITEFRYDTIDVWFQKRQASRLERLVKKQSDTLSVRDLQAEISKLSAEDRLEFLKKLANGK